MAVRKCSVARSAMLGHDERRERRADSSSSGYPVSPSQAGFGAHEATLGVERIHRIGVMLEQRAIPLLALAQPVLGGPSRGDVLEEDREPAGVRKMRFSNQRSIRRIVRLDLMRLSVRDGTLVLPLKRLSDAFGKLGPDVLPDERCGSRPNIRPACALT